MRHWYYWKDQDEIWNQVNKNQWQYKLRTREMHTHYPLSRYFMSLCTCPSLCPRTVQAICLSRTVCMGSFFAHLAKSLEVRWNLSQYPILWHDDCSIKISTFVYFHYSRWWENKETNKQGENPVIRIACEGKGNECPINIEVRISLCDLPAEMIWVNPATGNKCRWEQSGKCEKFWSKLAELWANALHLSQINPEILFFKSS